MQEIVQVPIPYYDNDNEDNLPGGIQEKCQSILNALTDEEIQEAAWTSYAYWYIDHQSQQEQQQQQQAQVRVQEPLECHEKNVCVPQDSSSSSHSSSSLLHQSALKEIRRHLMGAHGNVDKAMKRLQDSLRMRMEHQVHLLRHCFDDKIINTTKPPSSSSTITKLRSYVTGDMKKQPVVMSGNDKEGRAVLMKFPRREGGVTEEEYWMTQLYIAERAMACTEFLSRGRHERIVAVFDFATFRDSSHAPPLKWQLSVIRNFQQMYPERLHKLLIVEPPFWMRGLFVVIKQLLSKDTTQKIQIVNDRSQLIEAIQLANNASSPENDSLADEENIISSSQVNVTRYLEEIPFFCPYNCEEYLAAIIAS